MKNYILVLPLLIALSIAVPFTGQESEDQIYPVAAALLSSVRPTTHSLLIIDGKAVGKKYLVADTHAEGIKYKKDHVIVGFRAMDSLLIMNGASAKKCYGEDAEHGVIIVYTGKRTGNSFTKITREGDRTLREKIAPQIKTNHIHNKYGYRPSGGGRDFATGYHGTLPVGVQVNVNDHPREKGKVFELTLDRQHLVKAQVLNKNGFVITTLLDRTLPKGKHQINWMANGVKNGKYTVTLEVSGHLRVHSLNVRGNYVGPY